MAFAEEIRALLSTPGLSATERCLLAYLRARQGINGRSWPSTDTLCEAMQVSWRHIYRMLRTLEEKKYLTRKREDGTTYYYMQTDIQVTDPDVTDTQVSKTLTPGSISTDLGATRKEQGRNIEGTSPVEENHFIEACESLQQYWNSKVRGSIPKIKKLTAERRAALRRLSKDDDWKQNYRESILKMAASSFLQGRHDGAWHADFDWWLNLGRNPLAPRGTPNWLKCYEGNYDDEVAS